MSPQHDEHDAPNENEFINPTFEATMSHTKREHEHMKIGLVAASFPPDLQNLERPTTSQCSGRPHSLESVCDYRDAFEFFGLDQKEEGDDHMCSRSMPELASAEHNSVMAREIHGDSPSPDVTPRSPSGRRRKSKTTPLYLLAQGHGAAIDPRFSGVATR